MGRRGGSLRSRCLHAALWWCGDQLLLGRWVTRCTLCPAPTSPSRPLIRGVACLVSARKTRQARGPAAPRALSPALSRGPLPAYIEHRIAPWAVTFLD